MISVIVIAYNADNTIGRCIDSIISQSYSDFELIIINDGSTDHTEEIIKQYAAKDTRIRFKSHGNTGVAFSRQEGLDWSNGDYTIFVDSDDWVEKDYLEALYECASASNSDMVICDMLVERRDKVEYMCESPQSLRADEILGQMLNGLHGSLCNKLISKSAYARTGVRFLPGLNCCEDLYVVMSLLANDISVSYLNRALYHYDKTANCDSITNNWLDFPVISRVNFIQSIKPFIINDIQKQYYNNYIGSVAYTATASSKVACPNYRELFKAFEFNIKQAQMPMFKKVVCLMRLKGMPVPTRIIKMIRRYFQNLTH